MNHQFDQHRIKPMTFEDIPAITAVYDTLCRFWQGRGWTYHHGAKAWLRGTGYMTMRDAMVQFVERDGEVPF